MLANWLWRFAVERSSWWRILIEIKYPNPRSIWQTDRARMGFSHSVWANISKAYDFFWKFASMDPGNGTSISFWYDVWVPGMVLASAFPRVAAAAVDPNASLSDVASFDDGTVRWSITLKYSLRGGAERERVQLLNFLQNCEGFKLNSSPCRIIWNPDYNCKFSVRSCYKQVSKDFLVSVQDFPAKQIWRPVIPLKVCFFMWLACHNRILTMDNLMKRGWSLASRCILCCRENESAMHVLMECDFTKDVWSFLNRNRAELGFRGSDSSSVIKSVTLSEPVNVDGWFASCILHAVWWGVWIERNQRIFEEKASCASVVAKKAARHSMEWLVAHGKVEKSQGEGWLKDAMLAI
ncbi:unnamed protein product [Linum trigynum]|uniref:Reverse transcriptase zinc-binding domain-containing protein n=1 Tax=Linum trigynum TaxID=586398 RepID=A0AAV2FNE5_9ROSI